MAREFVEWRDAVVASLAQRDDVVGVAGAGSTAATARADTFSDLDLFILVLPGAEDRYRHQIDWLPDADEVVLHLVEWHGGGKVLFGDGRMIEWGVGTPEAVSTWLADDAAVLLDHVNSGVAEAIASAQANPYPLNDMNRDDALATFVFAIHHGMGRVRRGEVVSGGEIIRSEAAAAMLRAARAGLAPTDPTLLDRLDIRRRVERAFPELAADLADALEGDPEGCARALVAVAQRHFAYGQTADGLPGNALDAVRPATAGRTEPATPTSADEIRWLLATARRQGDPPRRSPCCRPTRTPDESRERRA